MKLKLLILSILAITTNSIAANDFASIGAARLGVSGDHEFGVGISGARIDEGKEWGLQSSFDFARKDDAKVFDLMLGPIYRPASSPWLRAYPFAGVSYFSLNGNANLAGNDYTGVHYERAGFAYGAGFQISIPNSPVYIEANYKKMVISHELNDFNFDMTYLGIGCNF
jgi:hypothetical protein